MKQTLRAICLLVHYWFPIGLGWSVAMVIQRATGWPFSPVGFYLFLVGIWAAYSLDRLLDPPAIPYPMWLRWTLWTGCMMAVGTGLVAVWWLPRAIFPIVCVLSLVSLSYRRLKRFPLLKTLVVALVWVWAGATLPVRGSESIQWNWWWTIHAVWPLLFLTIAGCLLCDLKDEVRDQQTGVQSLPVVLGQVKTAQIATGLALVAGLLAFSQGRLGVFWSSLLLAGIAQFPKFLKLEAIGPLLVDAILALPGILIVTHLV
ncbi:MAG: UbiA family prenyltransferase [Blastocatellia bacterium]|nr:UbiA family prenyltransferase [Blastocatellia bacterium]